MGIKGLKPLIVGAPFGNYFGEGWATRTLGSFTKEYRGGRMWRAWKVGTTVRYYHGIGAWKNKLGLPNPGIQWLRNQVNIKPGKRIDISDKIVSVFAFDGGEATDVILMANALHSNNGRALAIELNVSCPNVDGGEVERILSEIGSHLWRSTEIIKKIILKVPPVGYRSIVDAALSAGIDSFHCCNTLPTSGGGLSGNPLMKLSLEAVSWVRNEAHADGTIIGGGGITCLDDIHRYQDAGADSFAIASCLFNPLNHGRMRRLGRLLMETRPCR